MIMFYNTLFLVANFIYYDNQKKKLNLHAVLVYHWTLLNQ